MLNNTYFKDFKNNNNLNVYVIDRNVNLKHPELEYINTKGKLGGFKGKDVHGTTVASIIVGKTVGVIRNPNIHLYNYAACDPKTKCPEDEIFTALKVVLRHLSASGRRGVINMSFNNYIPFRSSRMDSYFKDIIDAGGIIVNSAGNQGQDACLYEPALSPYIITVGGYTYVLDRVDSSNFGDCVDTWAPGDEIYAAEWKGYGFHAGTSVAAPAVIYVSINFAYFLMYVFTD